MEKYLGILKKCAIFKGIEDQDLIRMLTCFGARIEFFDKKYTVFSEGMSTKYLGVLLSGAVQTVQIDYYGNRTILSKIHPTDTFGEAFALAEIERLPISIVATEPSYVMLIDCSHILHTCHNACPFHHRIIFNVMKALAEKNISLHEKAFVTSKRTTREKLLAYLDGEVKKSGSNKFDIPFDRQELADYLEVERSGLSREISKMTDEGILKSKKRRFEIL